MDNKIIFIGGIHGVGKTSLCVRLTDSKGINNFSASQLIKMLKTDYSDDKNKGVKNISNNPLTTKFKWIL